ncbi:MAG TPA: T9SS type A sorting domain-containing protein [Bacteroidetes bacterium]|nr:T9SS type A sorting domain-containing protein [Bacteroidota bacterium]
MKALLTLIVISDLVITNLCTAETHLTPLDFGFKLLDHGMVDYSHPPQSTLAGRFNSDNYTDIARFDGPKLDVFLCDGFGFPEIPQLTKTFTTDIQGLHFAGPVWEPYPPLKVLFTDGSEALFPVGCNGLDLGGAAASLPSPPRGLDDLDFQIVWESPEYPEKMNKHVVGDVDGDGVMEFISTWRTASNADTAHIVIYKNSGDNTYDLYMDELFTEPMVAPVPGISYFLITDIDQNGHKELTFTYDGCYFWEFTAPGQYTEYRSNFIFPRCVADAKISDVDQDGVPELTTVMRNFGMQPPCAYWVCEFAQKDTVNHNMNFTILSGFWQDWIDARLAVGDFDRDGAVDLVPGNFYLLWSWYLVDLPFYRYNPASPSNFDLYWMPTGLAIRCATPVLEDFDQDGELELFAGGFGYGQGGAYLWESTGFMSGYPAWVDTVNMPAAAINFSSFGWVDGIPSVVSEYGPVVAPTTTSMLSLWQWHSGSGVYAWATSYIYSSDYRLPQLADMDGDGKVSILLAEDDHNQLLDWEQVSTGIQAPSQIHTPERFKLYPVSPNPFNPRTTLRYDLPQDMQVKITVYDVTGRQVTILMDNYREAGTHFLTWDAGNLPSGVYFAHIRAGEYTATSKLLLTK